MQIILVSGRLRAARTVTIMPRHVVLAVLLFCALVFGTSALFSWVSVHLRLPLVQDLILSLQQSETRQTQEVVRNNLQMMATRVGELQAQVLQLDKLGDRLAALAGIAKEGGKGRGGRDGQGGAFVPVALDAEQLQREIERLAGVVDARTDELTMIERQLLEQRVKDRLLPTTLPVQEAVIGSGFGQRSDPIAGIAAMHEGIDFNAETGTPVVAAAAGVVLAAEYHPEFGNVIDIDHGEGLISRYAHLSRSLARPGQLVKRGQRIGDVGSTGRSTGAHLHFEVRMLGVAQNPAHFLKQGADYASARHR